MLIMYRGFELVPVKDGERWQAQVFSGGRRIAATPLAVGFLFVPGGPLVFVLLALLGFVLVSTFTVSVVLGQAYLPKHPGMASGLIVGFAIGAGGVGASALGWVADHWGLTAALGISAVMPMVGFLVALFLPDPKTGGAG